MVKKAKSHRNRHDDDDDDDDDNGWVEDTAAATQDVGVEPQAVPGAALSRATTVTTENPTPPTNVPVVYQGSPPTQSGLTPAQAPAPDVSVANIFLFADPLNGAVTNAVVGPPYVPAITPTAQLAGKAEGDGSETTLPYDGTGGRPSHGRLSPRGVGPSNFSETPNASHPSYGT